MVGLVSRAARPSFERLPGSSAVSRRIDRWDPLEACDRSGESVPGSTDSRWEFWWTRLIVAETDGGALMNARLPRQDIDGMQRRRAGLAIEDRFGDIPDTGV